MKKSQNCRTTALAAALLLVGVANAAAAPPSPPPALQVTAQVGWGGWLKHNRWAPCVITIANRGPARRVRLELKVPVGVSAVSRYEREVDLPSPSRRTEILYFRATAFSDKVTLSINELPPPASDTNQKPAPVLLFRKSYEPELVPASQPLIVTLSESRAGQETLFKIPVPYDPSQSSSLQMIYAAPTAWPDRWFGFDGIDLIVLSDYSPRKLDAAACGVLEQWIESGGRMLVLGGETGLAVRGTPIERLLPVKLTGKTKVVNITTIHLKGKKATGQTLHAEFTGQSKLLKTPLFRESNTVYGRLSYSGGSSAQPGIDARAFVGYLADKVVGKGYVVFLGLNDLRPPIAGSESYNHLLHLIQSGVRYPNYPMDADEQEGYLWAGPAMVITDVPALALPSKRHMTGLLLLYVFLLGPLHFALARKIRWQVAWVTFPAGIALFAGATYLRGREMKGRHVLINQVSVVRSVSGATQGTEESLIGVLSPDDTAYTLKPRDPSTLLFPPPPRWGLSSRAVPGIGQNRVVSDPRMRFQQMMGGMGNRGTKIPDEAATRYLQTDRLSLQKVRIKWGAMELFRTRSLVPMGEGVRSHLNVDKKTGRLQGWVENATSFSFSDALLLQPSRRGAWRIAALEPGGRVDVKDLKASYLPWSTIEREYLRNLYDFDPNVSEPKRKDEKATRKLLMSLLLGGFFQVWGEMPVLAAHVDNPPPSLAASPGQVEERRRMVMVVEMETATP